MSKGEGLYPAPTKKSIEDLDAKISNIQKSTRAVIPAMVPLHDILRQKFRWYYLWSAWPVSKFINLLILIVYLGGAGFFAYNFLSQPKRALAATATYNFVGVNNPAGAPPAPTHRATRGTTQANPPAGTELLSANYDSIESSDDSRFSTAGATNAPPYQQFRFYVDSSINISQITNIDVAHEGYVNDSSRTLKIWNRNTSSWQTLVDSSSTSENTISGSVTVDSDTANYYIDPSTRYIYAEILGSTIVPPYVNPPGNTIYTDYVRTILTYNVPPSVPAITSPNGTETWPLNSSANPVTWSSAATNQVEAQNLTQYDNFNDNSIDGTLWTTLTSSFGVTLAETSSEIQITGTAAGGTATPWMITSGVAADEYVFQTKVKIPALGATDTSQATMYVRNSGNDRRVYISYAGSSGWSFRQYDGTTDSAIATIGKLGNEVSEYKTIKIIVNKSLSRSFGYVYDADGTEHYLGMSTVDITKGGTDNSYLARLGGNAANGSTIDVRFDDFMLFPVNISLDKNFDSQNVGQNPAGWTLINEPALGTITVQNDQSVSAPKSLKMAHNGGSGSLIAESPTFNTDGINYLEFDARVSANDIYSDFGYLNSSGNLKSLVYFNSTGKVGAYNGVNLTDSATSYTANNWHHFLIQYDSRKQTFNAWFNGTLIARNYAVYSSAGDGFPNRFRTSFSGPVRNVWLDNIQSYTEFKTINGLTASTTSATWDTTGWDAGIRYLARARTLSGSLWGPWDYSDDSFTLYDVPVAPTILDPTDGETDIEVNPTVTSSAFSGSGSHTVSDWEIYDDAAMGTGDRVWYKNDDVSNLTSIVVNVTNGTFENALVGQTALANATQYWIRVRHANAAGDSAWSVSTHDFTTLAGTSPVAPTIGVPTVLSATSIRWNFTDNASNEIGFKVHDVSHNVVVTCVGSDLTYCDEINLSVNTQYTRHIHAYNNDGDSDPSADAAIYTFANTPNAPTVNATSSTSLTIIIDQNSNPTGPAPAGDTEYAISCDSDTTFLNHTTNVCGASVDWQTYATWGDVGGFTDTGLGVNTQHTYKVIARNGNNVQAPTDIATAPSVSRYTFANQASAPTIAAQSWVEANGNAMQITVNANSNPSGTNYKTEFKEVTNSADCAVETGFSTFQDYTAHDNGDNISHTGRTADQYICYRMMARNGDLVPTAVSSVANAQAAPAQPTGLSHTTNTTTTITWNLNDNAVLPDGYHLLNNSDEQIETSITSDFVQNQSDPGGSPLTANTQYAVKARAYRGAITGQPTATAQAYTSIEEVTGISWGTFTTASLSAVPANNPSNLTAGTSGIQYCNTTTAACSAWQQNVDSWESAPLSVNTQYTFSIQSRNGDGETTDSATAQKYTRANIPGNVGHSMATADVTLTSLKWTWELNSNPGYTEFCVNDEAHCGVGATNLVDNDPARSPNTQYASNIYAKNGDGVLTDSVLATGYTAIEAPSTITAGLITPNSIALNLSDSLTNLAVGSSGIQYAEVSGNQNGGGEAAFTTWPQTASTTDTGLKGATSGVVGTTYKYKIKARNAESVETSYSTEYEFTTTAGVQLLFALPGESISENGSHLLTYTDPNPSTVVAGVPFNLTIYAADGSDYRDLAHEDTITLSSTDTQATFPVASSMSNGQLTYNNVVMKTVGNQTITGSGSAGSSHEFTVVAGTCSPTLSTITANPSTLTVSETSTITVTLKDAFGNKLTGHTVSVSSDQAGDVFTNNSTNTDANGQATIYLSSGLAHTSTLTATDTTDGVVLSSHPQVTFNLADEPEGDLPVDNPTNFTGTAGDRTTSLSWKNPGTNFSHIHIYRSTSEGELGDRIADNIDAENYTDRNLTNGTIYYYILKAVSTTGQESSGTYQLSLTPTGATDNEPPTAPTNLRATDIGTSAISLAWDASTDNVGVVGYRIYNANTGIQVAAAVDTFVDLTGLSPETEYTFYVVAYDAASNVSDASNSLTVTTLPLEPGEECVDCVYICRKGGGRVAFLILSNVPPEISSGKHFSDDVQIKAIAADGGGSFCEDYRGTVYFASTDERANLVWNKNHAYTFNKNDSGAHAFPGKDFILYTVGNQELTVTDNYVSGKAEIKVLGGVVFQKAQDKITDFFDKNASKVNTAVITTTTALLLTPALVNVAIGLGNILPQILYWLTQLLQLVGIRKRRKPWGIVFNSQTGQPVSLAVVRIYDKEYNRLLETMVTDKEGRFGFLAKPGTFYIRVQKSGFTFPSAFKVSGFYENIYTGGNINIKGNESIAFNIPLDPLTKTTATFNLWVFLVKLNRLLQKIRIPLLIIGSVFAIVMIIKSYHIIYALSLALYLLLGVYELARMRKAKPYGLVSDIFGHPLQTSIVRIYEKKSNRLVGTDVTDSEGRFRFLVAPGIYYLTAQKPGYIDFKSHIMYLEKEKTLVTTNIKLKKVEIEK